MKKLIVILLLASISACTSSGSESKTQVDIKSAVDSFSNDLCTIYLPVGGEKFQLFQAPEVSKSLRVVKVYVVRPEIFKGWIYIDSPELRAEHRNNLDQMLSKYLW
jgi:hypothetical protein